MFRPGNIGHLGRLGLVAASQPSLIAQALAILARYGSAANLYLPGVGAINGLQAGNWLDGIGTTAATVDNPVGTVVNARGGANLVTNGDFSNGTTGWTRGNTGTQTIESGALRVASDGTAAWSGISETTIPALTKGKQYLVQFSVLAENTSSGAGLYFRTSSLSIGGIFTNGLDYFYPSAVGNYSILYTATVDNINQLRIVAGGESNASVLFDNISVRELPGAHLTQSTAANRPVLRRGLVNQLTQSDFQNGVTDAPIRGGLVTASTLSGYGGAIAFGHDGSATSYGYKLFAATLNAAYTLAFVVKMDDGNAPVFGNVNSQDASNPFAVVMYGNVYSPIGAGGSVTALADNTYLVTCSAVATAAVATNFGVVKYPANNNRTFKVTRYGLFTGTVTASQILAAGGIPLTTTAPASSTNGPFAWQFDGSNDSFASTMTPGNAGFFCSGAQVNDSGVLRTLLGAGAGSDASSGVWLARQVSSNLLMLQVGNGTTRNSIGAPYPVTTNAVASAGWDSSAMFVGINGTETSGAKTVNCTSSNTMNLGVLTGTTNPMLGTIGATIIMPTVLPTASERATLRQFIASLSGVTM